MKGTNELVLNAATMMEAVAYWLSKEVLQDDNFEVTSIIYVSQDSTFRVVLAAKEEVK